ncbi:hypothetical protein [Blastopirellula marina]|uniref:Uncharacterized protein n=1 Tax=Blastopirellula marina TaxID=124 RepID=A0A2S8GKN0_9BACT|nr:hypothetical protein C5Y93_17415 [Blastopirellula marina]
MVSAGTGAGGIMSASVGSPASTGVPTAPQPQPLPQPVSQPMSQPPQLVLQQLFLQQNKRAMASFSGVQLFLQPHLPANRLPWWWPQLEAHPQEASGAQHEASGAQHEASGAQQEASGAQHEASGAEQVGSQPQDEAQQLFLQLNRLCRASFSGVQLFFLQQLVAQGAAQVASGAQQLASGAQQVGSGAQQVAATGAQQEGFGMQQRGLGVQHFGV